MRFVEYDGGRLYALKELPERSRGASTGCCASSRADEMPVVEVVGVVTERGDDARGGPDHAAPRLLAALPHALRGPRHRPDLRDRLLDAGAELLVRLHLAGFFWGDCSLSNTLFRRDAGALAAYLVDAETGELHPTLSDGQRAHDLEIAEENVPASCSTSQAELGRTGELHPEETAAELVAALRVALDELTRDEVFGPDERYRIDERLRRLNELGFDVEELELVADDDGYRLRLNPRVVEPGHHRRRLLTLTGLHAQENQARRLLNDLARFRAELEQRGGKRPCRRRSSPTAGSPRCSSRRSPRCPAELWGSARRPRSSTSSLEHRWYLSQQAGEDVGLEAGGGVVRRRRAPPRARRAGRARARRRGGRRRLSCRQQLAPLAAEGRGGSRVRRV